MKLNLGKIILILIFINSALFATTYKWTAEINKKSAFINEAIYLKYICEFSDRAGLHAIDFNPVGNYEYYDIVLLSENEQIRDAKKINTFEFLAYVKKAGVFEFDFKTVMKKTTQGSIENTVLGRDNMQKEQFFKTSIKQKVLKVEIKKTDAKLVGNFLLDVKKDKDTKKAYEPYHLEYLISGIGDFSVLKPIEFKIDGVKIFHQKPIKNITLTPDGYSGSWSQKFAFVSDEDFEIPSFNREYIDILDGNKKVLKSEKLKVKIQKAVYKKEQLLDKKEDEFEFSFDFIYYILTFLAGVLIARIR